MRSAVLDQPALTAGQIAAPAGEEESTADENISAEEGEAEVAGETADENALIASSDADEIEERPGPAQTVEARLPVQLNVGIPIRGFRVRNLVMLERNMLVESHWAPGEDVPVLSGDVQLAWSEFEVVEQQLAVRLTRLA